MTKFLLLLIAVVTFSCSDKIEVSGHRVDVARALSGYQRIHIAGNMRLNISKGNDSVVIKTFESVHNYVKTSVEGDELRVALDENLEFDNEPNVVVTIFCSAIHELMLKGAIDVSSNSESFFDESKVSLNLSRGAFLNSRIKTKEMVVACDGGGLKLYGDAETLRMEVNGKAVIGCIGFYTDFLEIDLNGGSECDINVNDRINKATISGGSKLIYRGTHIVNNVNVTGGSELISKN